MGISVQCVLRQRLQGTLNLLSLALFGREVGEAVAIPLTQRRDGARIVYQSGIALKLASVWDILGMEIAAQLANGFREQAVPEILMAPVLSHFEDQGCGLSWVDCTVKVVPPGILQFELSDGSIAAWLQNLTRNCRFQQTELPIISDQSLDSSHLFLVQYSHARCCSLLRLADGDKIIKLRQFVENQRVVLEMIQPNPLPWLDETQNLRLIDPAEYYLMGQLMAIVDMLDAEDAASEIYWETLAQNLSEAFQQFYRQCRIWGEVKIATPKLAQTRLGLVLVTQKILQLLLQKKLGVEAPLEL